MPIKRTGLVIDTTVAMSAGETEHPVSSKCRKFLMEVLTICHCLVTSTEAQREWKRHASPFSRKWLVSMWARKKVIDLGSFRNDRLRGRLSNTSNKSDLDAMMKDIHLIEAALQANSPVISLDERARSLFSEATRKVTMLEDIIWVNPTRDEESALNWLRKEAKPEAKWRLGYKIAK